MVSETTTIEVYRDDHTYLKRRQREVSSERGAWIPMADVMRELIEAAVKAGESE